ncbi:hypothetical protein DSO57_1012698 [Entomophthora muscae]|uniref:Uncharacterized protein n=1 Tax=Entomophthora muscae TaxID=34485 RepID=A0ACC2SIZ6_9FUNG|nr:hypothetical protein DSO57_1012698 [Entomophthora muscae]
MSEFNITQVSSSKCHNGFVKTIQHPSTTCSTAMEFMVFLPNKPAGEKVPAVIFLSGLGDDHTSLINRTGATQYASDLGMALICPDTSPRNTGIDGETGIFSIGTAASFYIDATQPKWAKHYRMYSYITKELISLAESCFNIDPARISISGVSMGGHGAMVMTLTNPSLFRSCSAISPGCHPSEARIASFALTEYLGEDVEAWRKYDTICLLEKQNGIFPIPTCVSQGDADPLYLSGQLNIQKLLATAKEDENFSYSLEEGYDHSFFFVASVIKDHLHFHARHLGISF